MHMQSLGSTRKADFPLIEVDFTKDTSVEQAMWRFRETHGLHIASFIHLVAFFDLSGEENPRYQSVNVECTRRPMYALYLGADDGAPDGADLQAGLSEPRLFGFNAGQQIDGLS
jgi:hypothetical protein